MPISKKLHPYWYVWAAMIQRCTNPKHPSYHRYGGRGIVVCDRWLKMANFEADMGPPPFPGASLERIDNDKGYDPGNCKWATTKEQAMNKHFALGESGRRGVVRNRKGWAANYYDPLTEANYRLGTYKTIDEASVAREKFIATYENDVGAALAALNTPRVRSDSSTGATGVSPSNGRYHAYVHVKGGKRINIGYFNTIEEAVRARQDYIDGTVAQA